MSARSGKTRTSCPEEASCYKSLIVLRKNPKNNLRRARKPVDSGFFLSLV
ncbi:MAG: hypothetical protein PHF18_04400 [Methanosarcina sp.]|nr:hypothetical protein [Methanosarcina sp.]MDD3246088.1 hypothetical protein [Methanosarcina sp.]MDD4250449.1 hypothetical protein [Methanosarcina sp.]